MATLHQVGPLSADAVNGSSSYGHANGVVDHSKPLDSGPNGEVNIASGALNGVSERSTNPSHFAPIAICGMACRLPGGIGSPSQLWELLLNSQDAQERVPKDRYNVDTFYSPKEKAGTVKTQFGYFLDEDLASFDGSFFSMSPMELARCDPQQRLLLEAAHECLEDAGEIAWRGKEIGVYVGNFGEDWHDMMQNDPQQNGVYRLVGSGDFGLANRVSYEMDLHGPSMTVRTACSSALVGLNEACMAILRGDCHSAIVGGASIILMPDMTIKLSEQGVLSKSGSCKAFSADADGYARAEAINAIFIKPLKDAIRDGNTVRAVIRGTAVNSDGKTPGISYPDIASQEALIRRAYEVAGLSKPGETAFVECHGTGTPVGDPIETTAVANVFGDGSDKMYIGSIKPNVGHSEGASGLSSLIKAVLALENRTIPPNIKFTQPNRSIPWERGLEVPTEATPWPTGKRERVSVNSFGIGGVNAHVVIDSAASHRVRQELEEANDEPHLLVYSAKSPESLREISRLYSDYISQYPERLTDLAFTLANKREHFNHRAYLVASREQPGSLSPLVKGVAKKPKVVMVFTGQGAQWPQMGRDLLRQNATFKATIKSLDKVLKNIGDAGPGWTIEAELRKPARTSRLDSAALSQPLCTAIQIALVDAFEAVGIVPDAVVGHSSGEISGAYAAGALTKQEAIVAAYHRGVVADYQKRPGAMAAVGMSSEDVRKYLNAAQNVGVACENSPKSVTLSGDAEQVKVVVAKIQEEEPGVLARLLKVDKAYHSYHMAEVGEYYHSLIGGAPKEAEETRFGKQPQKPLFSSVTGALYEDVLGPKYWQKNLESPVLFRSAIASLLQHSAVGESVFLEIGPHSALAGPLRQTQAEAKHRGEYISAMLRGQNSAESFLSAIGKLYTLHVPVSFSSLYPQGTCLYDLPRYQWNKTTSYWHESRVSKERRFRPHAHHDLLGVKVVESSELEPIWRNLLHLDNAPWIRDHRLGDDIVFPFAAYVGMAAEAVRQISRVDDGVTLRNTAVSTALIVTDELPTELVTSLRLTSTSPDGTQWWSFSISSYNEQNKSWISHCTGEGTALIKAKVQPSDPDSLSDLPRKVDLRRWYEVVRRGGLNFGPTFQRWIDVRTSTTHPARATASVSDIRLDEESKYHIHPTIVDGALQMLVIASSFGLGLKYRNNLAISVGELTLFRPSDKITANVVANIANNGDVSGSGSCIAGSEVVLNMVDVRLAVLEEPIAADPHAAARLIWKPHADFIAPSDLITHKLEHPEVIADLAGLYDLSLVYSGRIAHGIEPLSEHLKKYRHWLVCQIDSRRIELSEYHDLTTEYLLENINHHMALVAETPLAGVAHAIVAVAISIGDILSNTQDPQEILYQSDMLNDVEQLMNYYDISSFVSTLAHKRPNIRILEIGGGTGAATEMILSSIGSSYSKYTFSDVSSAHLDSAKERFKSTSNIDFRHLDIEHSLIEQEAQDLEYDLVIANNAVHSTANLSASLNNLRKLLHPDGHLVLHELAPSSKWINFILGTLPGWWRGGDLDQRHLEPYVDLSRWKSEIEAAGFDSSPTIIESTVDGVSSGLTAIIVARPARSDSHTKHISLLVTNPSSASNVVEKFLEERGYIIRQVTLDQDPPPGQDIVSLLDHEEPFFKRMTAEKFIQLKEFMGKLNKSGVFWVTPSSSIGCKNPLYGQVLGFARVLRSEIGVDFAVCQAEEDLIDGATTKKIIDVFDKFHQRRYEGNGLAEDMEYVIKDDQVLVGRFSPFNMIDLNLAGHLSNDRAVIKPGRRGRLNEIHWEFQPINSLQDDQVELNVEAASLSIVDSLSSTNDIAASGLAASGLIHRVGSQVHGLTVGDRAVIQSQRILSSTVIAPEKLAIKIPDGLSTDDAVILLSSYTRMLYVFEHVQGLTPGASVLIHDAFGQSGLAAFELASLRGADVYLTVRSQDEKQGLVDRNINGITDDRLLLTSSASWTQASGEGFDLILVHGLHQEYDELLEKSWRSVAAFGTLVQLQGRTKATRNLARSGSVNRCLIQVDMHEVGSLKPEIINHVMKGVISLYQHGHIKLLLPTKIFSGAQLTEALHYAQDGQERLENVNLQLRSTDSECLIPESSILRRKRISTFDAKASYVLVGGLGGLGRSVSIWMVENGARNLVLMSRSAGLKSEDLDFKRELESMGCDVHLVPGDVTKAEDVKHVVDVAINAGPLKGIHQMSIVLRDEAFSSMSLDSWNAAVLPKVNGTWNLHQETLARSVELDFFLVFSAISGLIGQPGQANYASANTFLDAFVQYRNDIGLAASAVQIGPVEDTGIIASNPELLSQLKSTGFYLVREKEVLEAVEAAIAPETDNSFVIGMRSTLALSNPNNRVTWRRDPRMALFHNSGSNSAGGAAASSHDGLKAFLAKARADPSVLMTQDATQLLAIEIGRKVLALLVKPTDDEINTNIGLVALGLDSLVGIEMRQWIKTALGVDISVVQMLGMGTLEMLAKYAAEGLTKVYQGHS